MARKIEHMCYTSSMSREQPGQRQLVSLGEQNQLGDVVFGDIAGGDIVKLTVNLFLHAQQGHWPRASPPLVLEQLPPRALLHEAARLLDWPRRAAGVRLAFEFGPAPALLAVSPRLAARAVACLLENALRQTPPGGVVLLRAAPAPLAAGAERPLCALEVRDFGKGLHAAELQRLLTQPLQAHAQHRQHGLGIPFAQVVAEAHGGQLWAVSTPGKGSTFTLALPVEAPCASPSA